MDVLEAIQSRQSIGALKPDPVPEELIKQLLTAAVQAPNHYKVRPWRLVVLTGAGRERMGAVLAASFAARFPTAPKSALEKERTKPLRAPLVIAVGVDRPAEARVLGVENICAAAAACQNLLLAAHALGLGAKWRTGEAAGDPRLKEFLGLDAEQDLIALIYIGIPEGQPPPPARPGFEDRTVWIK
ncbi:MAG: nitroreductase [Anaerolineales bacterium]|nr:nitroreductase [Anaerolineales bacterium]